MTALQQLNRLADEAKAVRYPNAPFRVKSRYDDSSANSLTKAVVAFIELSGGFATRLSSTGVYREDLKRFVPSQQKVGLPDVLGLIDGRPIFVEIKYGADRLSPDQKAIISDLIRAGAAVFVAHSFQDFHDWFMSLELAHDDGLPFGQNSPCHD